jgi:hypothetical protein
VLLLERRPVEPDRPAPAVASGSPDRAVAVPARDRATRPPESLLLAPGLALLAAASVLEAYRWFGIVADGASRPVAVAFVVLALATALALTRAGGRGARTTVGRTVVAAAGIVSLATAWVPWDHGGWARATVGVADLLLAATALVALVVGERSRRRNDVAS